MHRLPRLPLLPAFHVALVGLLCTLVLGAGTPSASGAPAKATISRARFHILSHRLTQRLGGSTPGMKIPMEAVGIYKKASGDLGGTAFLLGRPDAEGNALLLTAHHVALYQKKTVKGDRVLFHPGGATEKPIEVEVLETVASNRRIDYALLKVKLPRALQGLVEVSHDGVRTADLVAGQRLYNPSFPRIWQDEARATRGQRFVFGSPRDRIYALAKKGRLTPKMLQVGRAQGFRLEGFELAALPQMEGSSGSPVFSTDTHKLVGMLTAGGGKDLALLRPVATIMTDLRKRSRKIADPALRAVVDAALTAK